MNVGAALGRWRMTAYWLSAVAAAVALSTLVKW